MMTSNRPRGRRVQARVFRMINVPMRVLLSLPFPTPASRRLMLVHHIGRRTGRHYRQPVSYVTDGDTLLTPGGGRWTENLHDGGTVQLRLRGRAVPARAELVREPDEVDRLLRVMAAGNPMLQRFVRIPQGPEGHYDRDALAAAVQHGFRLVRWHVDAGRPAFDA